MNLKLDQVLHLLCGARQAMLSLMYAVLLQNMFYLHYKIIFPFLHSRLAHSCFYHSKLCFIHFCNIL